MKNSLLEEISRIKVIDAHEHLISEAERLAMKVDVFTLFDVYTRGDLNCAGMANPEIPKLSDASIPLKTRWKKFEPYWQKIRHTGYAQSILTAIREVYGFGDLNSQTYEPLSEKIWAANKPGLYESILAKMCGIETVLNQANPGEGHRLFKFLYRYDQMPVFWGARLAALEKIERDCGFKINTFEDMQAAAKQLSIAGIRKTGCVGFKMGGCRYDKPEPGSVTAAIRSLRDKGSLDQYSAGQNAIESCIIHAMIEASIELQVPMAVHVGPAWTTWINFHIFKPENMIPLLLEYRDAKFDIYHLGIPWHDEMAVIAKIYPNVWLNLCWSHIFSPAIAADMLYKLLDLVPTNKIIGFGGDYVQSVENVYGHLDIARRNIATALSRRIDKKEMTPDQAIVIARDWLYNNAKQLYGL
jgi:predicted TIM-barrel fold metal-dependent hydrolase